MSTRLRTALLGSILAVFAIANLATMRVTTATSDETSHLPAGYTYWRTGDFRLNPQHPPLVKLLAALPLLALAPRLDPADPGWTASPPDEWGFGFRFLYGNDADRLLFWGRMPMLLLGLVACLYVDRFARELFGDEAGLLAVALFATCPTVVGHAHLVTMDVPLSAFTVAALYHLRSFLARGRTLHLAATGIAVGCALATKFSGAVIAFGVLALLPFGARGSSVARRLAAPVVAAAIAAIVLWISYGCPLDPGFYVRGASLVNADHDPTVPDYLFGTFRLGGFWYYFPVAFVLKTPLPTLAAIAAGLSTLRRLRAPSWRDEACLLLPAGLFLLATCALAADIGVRYLLPVYAPLVVSAGRLAPWLLRIPGRRVLAGAGLVWLGVGLARAHPDGLSYFNEAAGGIRRGPWLLDDSNLDWGGGLKRLRGWMAETGTESVRLLYPWNGSPDYYGIRHEPVTAQDWLVAPRPGVYAISPQALVSGRLMAREKGARSDWLDRYEPVDRLGGAFWIYRFP